MGRSRTKQAAAAAAVADSNSSRMEMLNSLTSGCHLELEVD